LRALPSECMFSAAGTDDQNFHDLRPRELSDGSGACR
jgi:hypothetical protein